MVSRAHLIATSCVVPWLLLGCEQTRDDTLLETASKAGPPESESTALAAPLNHSLVGGGDAYCWLDREGVRHCCGASVLATSEAQFAKLLAVAGDWLYGRTVSGRLVRENLRDEKPTEDLGPLERAPREFSAAHDRWALIDAYGFLVVHGIEPVPATGVTGVALTGRRNCFLSHTGIVTCACVQVADSWQETAPCTDVDVHEVPLPPNIVETEAAEVGFLCARSPTTLYCWGGVNDLLLEEMAYYPLTDYRPLPSVTPRAVDLEHDAPVERVRVGDFHAGCALLEGGDLHCWGPRLAILEGHDAPGLDRALHVASGIREVAVSDQGLCVVDVRGRVGCRPSRVPDEGARRLYDCPGPVGDWTDIGSP